MLVDADGPARVLGYYTLSAAELLLAVLQEADRRRLPRYPMPAVRMGRLAVAVGVLLVHDVARCLGLREQLGVRVLLADALHDKVANFYRAYGFREAAAHSHTLYLPLGKA